MKYDKKILVLAVPVGTGHMKAAKAIMQALQKIAAEVAQGQIHQHEVLGIIEGPGVGSLVHLHTDRDTVVVRIVIMR